VPHKRSIPVILSGAKNPVVRPWQRIRRTGSFAPLRMTICFSNAEIFTRGAPEIFSARFFGFFCAEKNFHQLQYF
jgi:hypothetical protein